LELLKQTVKVKQQCLDEELLAAALFPAEMSIYDKNCLELEEMALKLQKYTLHAGLEAFTAQQEGRQPNLFQEDADMLIAECNILCGRIQKDEGNEHSVIDPGDSDHGNAGHVLQQHADWGDKTSAGTSSFPSTAETRSTATDLAVSSPAIGPADYDVTMI
jgi:hypothetical protein